MILEGLKDLLRFERDLGGVEGGGWELERRMGEGTRVRTQWWNGERCR